VPGRRSPAVDTSKLDLNLLMVFCAVMRRRSTTLAGEDLHMTQSAVSNALRRLRTHFGDKLFVSTPQGMMPTLIAERLAGPIQQSIDQIHSVIESVQAFSPASSVRTFRIYVSDIGQLMLMPKLVRVLEEEAPKVTIALVNVSPRIAQSMMADGEIDLAIGSFDRFQAGFHQQRMFGKSQVVLLRRGHPALKGGLTLQKFLRARHAVFVPPAGSQDSFETFLNDLFRQNNASRKVVIELAHGLGIAEVIGASDLMICVPHRLADHLAGTGLVTSAPLPFESPLGDVCQYWHDRVHADAGHKWLRALVFRNYAGM
jgi:DNA-binding transcriptional LysR family regulator